MEYIKNISLNLLDLKRQWDEADNIGLASNESVERIIEKIPDMDSAKIERLLRRIKDEREDYQNIIERIDEKLEYVGRNIENILEREYMLQSKYKIYLGYGITSLRNTSTFNWDNIFESIRVIEKVLTLDPIGVYENMDSQSKEYYRYNIKALAEKFNVQEIFIAKKVLEFAKEEYDSDQRDKKAHIGYYIIDKGRKELFNYFGYRKGNYSLYMEKFYYYALPIILISLFVTYIFTRFATVNNLLLNILIFIVLYMPVKNLVLNVNNNIYSKIYKPKIIPKIEYKDGIPEDKATLVVIPTLIVDENHLEGLIEDLEVYYLSNREENIYFAILGDFKDGDEKEKPEDDRILDKGLELIRKLNEKYSKDEDIFYYLHRERVLSKTQDRYMGWERKRGALVELNSLLLDEENTSFKAISGDISKLKGRIKYILTIDADTLLPIDSAKSLLELFLIL